MPEKYSWDAQAATGIKAHRLDEHFAKNLDAYIKIAKPIWKILWNHNQQPSYLKHDDLYAPLVPIFERNSMLQVALKKEGLPQAGERGNAKWLCWFAHYVVEKCLETSKPSKAGQDRELAKLKFKNKDKIKKDVEIEIKATKKSSQKSKNAIAKLLKTSPSKAKIKVSSN